MKRFEQKNKRRLARRNAAFKSSLWEYMSMSHVCPKRTQGTKRMYALFEDGQGLYLAHTSPDRPPIEIKDNLKRGFYLVEKKGLAAVFMDYNADFNIKCFKGMPGAWRAVRVK